MLVSNSRQDITSYKLRSDLRMLDPAAFRSRFGTHFVSAVVSGGSLYALLELVTRSEEVKEEISVGVEAKYDSKAFSIGGKFSSDFKNAMSKKGVDLRTNVVALGASPDWNKAREYDTVEQIIKARESFSDGISQAGAPMFAVLTPYRTLPDPPQSDRSVDMAALDALRQQLTDIYLQAKYVGDSISYALKNPREFSTEALDGLAAVQQEAANTLSEVIRLFQTLQQDPVAKITLPKRLSLERIPKRLWGGTLAAISPPFGVNPQGIRYKLDVARNATWALEDAKLRDLSQAYIAQVEKDISANLGNAYDFSVMLDANIHALTGKLSRDTAKRIVQIVAERREQAAAALATSIGRQKEQFASFSDNAQAALHLQFLSRNLNPYLWGGDIDDLQYGGTKYWEALKKTTDQLAIIADAWSAEATGAQYFSFKTGLWKQLKEAFREAMLTLYAPTA